MDGANKQRGHLKENGIIKSTYAQNQKRAAGISRKHCRAGKWVVTEHAEGKKNRGRPLATSDKPA